MGDRRGSSQPLMLLPLTRGASQDLHASPCTWSGDVLMLCEACFPLNRKNALFLLGGLTKQASK